MVFNMNTHSIIVSIYHSLLSGRYRFLSVILLIIFFASPAFADERQDPSRQNVSAWTSPLKFYQKIISRADGDRCPMYPSCSHYASNAFKQHGVLKGWILTCDRLLRCGHDEVRKAPKVQINGRLYTYDPVKVNTRWWSHSAK